MQSNRLYTLLLRHIFLIPTISMIGIGVKLYYGAKLTINGEQVQADMFDVLIFILLGLIFFLLWILLKNRVVRVKIEGQKITVYNSREPTEVHWTGVESLKQLIFVEPPLYKLRIKDYEGYFLFVTQPWYISFGFGTKDLSEMGRLIKKKRQQHGL